MIKVNTYLQSSLPAFAIDVTQSGAPLTSEYWGIEATSASRGEATTVMWFSRTDGIKRGLVYTFTIAFSLDGTPVVLTQQLTGTDGSTLLVGMRAGALDTGLLDVATSGHYPLYFTSRVGNRYRLDLTFRLEAFYGNAFFTLDSA